MTNGELIKILQRYDENLPVRVYNLYECEDIAVGGDILEIKADNVDISLNAYLD